MRITSNVALKKHRLYLRVCVRVCMCILRVNESPLWVRCLVGFVPVPTVGKRGHLG